MLARSLGSLGSWNMFAFHADIDEYVSLVDWGQSCCVLSVCVSRSRVCVCVCAAERRRSTPAPKEEEKVNEEQWPLKEVVFVEDVKNVPVGKVGVAEDHRGHPLPPSGGGWGRRA